VTGSLGDLMQLGSREGVSWLAGAEELGNVIFALVQATSETNHHPAPGIFLLSDGGFIDKIGVAAYTLVEYGAEWDGNELYDDLIDEYSTPPDDIANGHRVVMGDAPDFESRIKGYVVSVSAAQEIFPGFSFGVTGHALYSHFLMRNGGWLEETFADSAHLHPFQTENDGIGWGYGATVGLLYRVNNQISVGASARTPMTITHDGSFEATSTLDGVGTSRINGEFDFTYPLWAGLGFAYRDFLFEGATLTGDVHYTRWSAVDEMEFLVDGESLGTSELNWDNTMQIAVGFDVRVSRSLSARLGYRNVPDPVPDDTYDFVAPQSQKNVVTLGFGYRQDVWTLDFALEYYMGDERSFELEPWEWYGHNKQGKHLDDLIVPSLAFTYGF